MHYKLGKNIGPQYGVGMEGGGRGREIPNVEERYVLCIVCNLYTEKLLPITVHRKG